MLKYKIPQIVTLTQIIPAKNLLSLCISQCLVQEKTPDGRLVLFDQSIKRPGVFKDHHLYYQRYVVDLAHFYSSLW